MYHRMRSFFKNKLEVRLIIQSISCDTQFPPAPHQIHPLLGFLCLSRFFSLAKIAWLSDYMSTDWLILD